MPRRRNKMPENRDKDDIDEGRLPPSDITTLARGDDLDLDNMSTEELLTLIEDALEKSVGYFDSVFYYFFYR
jgi:hypothetical protein